MAPAIALVGGMPRLELIFLHSESADGCNARRVPAAARPSCQHYFDAPNDSVAVNVPITLGSFSHYGRGWKLMHRQGHRRFNRGDMVLDRLLHLFEGTRFNLAHALA